MSKRMVGNLMLLVAAMIWGSAFVAQSVGMDYVEPLTFQAVRCLLVRRF
jgi:drug/metabolite transporter (DMT)-like permease